MFIKPTKIISLFLLTILYTSCQFQSEPDHQSTHDPLMTQLGKQLKNPYSVNNMKQAWSNIRASNASANKIGNAEELTATHLYIKFAPANDEELDLLLKDSSINFYDHPLDYEIIHSGTYYHDPELPSTQPTFQYAAIKVNQNYPSHIAHEILSELYIPLEAGTSSNLSKSILENSLADLLEEEALKISGNLEGSSNEEQITLNKKKKWRPAGRIRVWDDNVGNYVAMQGVEVRANRWFTTHKGITNSSGYYSCDGTFKRDANYSIKWERYQFLIRDKALSAAKYNGPKKKGDWNLNIRNGAQEFYATIFRAAHHYYYKDIKGLRRPPQNGTLKTQMKIRAYNEKNDDKNGSHKEERRFLGLGSQIKIWNPQNSSRSIYGTTIHELAHASHWNMWRKGEDFDNSDKIVKESWARGVQWELTRMVYPGYVPSYWREKAGDDEPFYYYTGVVQDMIDGKSGYDQVSNYTIRQLEDALRSKKTWNSWRDNIKSSYNNSSEGKLNDLFSHWGL